MTVRVSFVLVLLAAAASAQELDGGVPAAQPVDLAKLSADVAALQAAFEKQQRLLEETQAQLEASKEEAKSTFALKGSLSGYLDVGAFWVEGDGSGIRKDTNYAVAPEYRGQVPDSWVFLGDPLATAINARGEPADTAESRAVTFDSINAGSNPSFIVNALGVMLFGSLGEQLSVTGFFDLLPRTRNISSAGFVLGDWVDVKLAYVEYLPPIQAFSLSLQAGKIDPVLGIEYRSQDAPDRFTVTPSLICRYTCGRPIGLKARAKFFDDEALVVALAVTNGSSFTENFPFGNELDFNAVKTGSGRISYRFPIGSGLELGASGAVGAQDFQPDNALVQWHFGFDLRLDIRDFSLSAEFVRGLAPGATEAGRMACGLTPCLSYRGAYGTASYRLTNWLAPYVRVDWRNALHRSGASFVYLSELIRPTVGLHFELGEYVVMKAEYTMNFELGRIPQFPNNVLTSALVVKY